MVPHTVLHQHQFQIGESRGRIDHLDNLTIISEHCEFLGSFIEALLDHELGLPVETTIGADPHVTPPHRGVCSQPLESDGQLADDVEEKVVIILHIVKFLDPSRHFHNLEDDLVGEGVERRRHGGGGGHRGFSLSNFG